MLHHHSFLLIRFPSIAADPAAGIIAGRPLLTVHTGSTALRAHHSDAKCRHVGLVQPGDVDVFGVRGAECVHHRLFHLEIAHRAAVFDVDVACDPQLMCGGVVSIIIIVRWKPAGGQQHVYEQHHTGTTTATAYKALSSPYAYSHSHQAAVVHHGMDATPVYDEYGAAAAAGNTHIDMDLISRGVGDGICRGS